MEDVEWGKEELVGTTEREENGTHVVKPHQGVGWEIRHFVRRISLKERGVHLNPVAGDVESYQELKYEEVGWVEVAKHNY